MNKKIGDYYIGLDCGTSSVGWAVTDTEYRLLRLKGKTAWGSRLFQEAQTAAERRLARGVRRRGDRADSRLKLLRKLFETEISKVDPDFYKRLDESFYILEDKEGLNDISSDTLFNDLNFKDKDFHKKYPTIWHLRNSIINSNDNESFDIRLYFLAIQHIMKHRGHFLFEGELKGNAGDFSELYRELYESSIKIGFNIYDECIADKVEKILCDKNTGKIDKKRKLKDVIVNIDELVVDDDNTLDSKNLADLIVGSVIDLKKLFALESDENYKLSLSTANLDEKMPEIEEYLGNDMDYVDVIMAAKRICDYVKLKDLLDDNSSISSAMVMNYEIHKKDLTKIKNYLKPFKEEYYKFFKDNAFESGYAAYVGKAFSVNKKGRRAKVTTSQEEINKTIKKLFEKCNIDLTADSDFAKRLEDCQLLPKQRGQAKGTIPQQLHHNELTQIVEKLVKDYPSFGVEVSGENVKYNTTAKKILSIHDFKRPYYCGPLVQKNKSDYSWADEEIKQIVYPWNFFDDGLVNLEARAEKFISRMTNDCTMLIGEKVLPKSSVIYQKFMVINEINNLKINGNRLEDSVLREKVYKLFYNGEVSGTITFKKLGKILRERMIIGPNDELGGAFDMKTMPKMSTHQDLKKILGQDYQKKYTMQQVEETVNAITIFGNERKMLKTKIAKILNCTDDEAIKLSKLGYKDWGKFSLKLLTGIKADIGVQKMSLIEAMEFTGKNHMELLGKQYDFAKAIEAFNKIGRPEKTEILYDDVKNLYCSPAAKRSVWQAVKIVKEIVQIIGYEPRKIFLESTREDVDLKNIGKISASRKKKIEESYKKINNDDAHLLLKELDGHETFEFKQKKLYLYYTQMCKCMYCGKAIHSDELATSAYDIDHIYPQSLTKDDSLEKNKVLVCRQCNLDKKNIYPLSSDVRTRMSRYWSMLKQYGLISSEKYDRLISASPLTDEQLGGFIARQIVETSQTVKAIRDLFSQTYANTKVVLVKAGQVSDLRHVYGYDHKNKDGVVIEHGNPEFIKIRNLNDYHHAKDAYLNVVVGDTMSQTFTDDPVNYIKKNHPGNEKHYSINPRLLFRKNETYHSKNLDRDVNWPRMHGWQYQKSFDIVSNALKRNDVLCTRMPHEYSSKGGVISDLNLVGSIVDSRSDLAEGILPVKNNARLMKTAKYGGLNSLKGAYFVLCKRENKKGDLETMIVQIPTAYKDKVQDYLNTTYPGVKVDDSARKILFDALVEIDGAKLYIVGRSGSSLLVNSSNQLTISDKNIHTLKIIDSYITKNKNNNLKLNITDDQIIDVWSEITLKLKKYYRRVPGMSGKIEEIQEATDKFTNLSKQEKCVTICELIKAMTSSSVCGDLSNIVNKSSSYGKITLSQNVSNSDMHLILQSPTGLIEKRVVLNKIKQ